MGSNLERQTIIDAKLREAELELLDTLEDIEMGIEDFETREIGRIEDEEDW